MRGVINMLKVIKEEDFVEKLGKLEHEKATEDELKELQGDNKVTRWGKRSEAKRTYLLQEAGGDLFEIAKVYGMGEEPIKIPRI